MQAVDTPSVPTHSPWRRFWVHVKYAMALNLICALIITFLLNGGHFFLENLFASTCIGTLAFALITGMRLLLWGDRRPPWPGFLLLLVLVIPVAQMIGFAFYRWVWGYSSSSLGDMETSKMISLIMFSLMVGGGATLFFSSREKMIRLESVAAQEKARAELIERQALQAQLQMLQAQIEPHMLFNTLANLQGLIGFDPARAQLLLDHLILYLRATLTSSRAGSTTLGQEFALMEAYLGLMAIRMGTRLNYTLTLPDELRAVGVAPMLLQPLVENAIQHGLEPKIDGGHIHVSVARAGDQLQLTVSDTGLGLDQPGGGSGGHVGLSNIRERLAALYGARATLSLENAAGGGALAQLTLPWTAR